MKKCRYYRLILGTHTNSNKKTIQSDIIKIYLHFFIRGKEKQIKLEK